MTFQQLRYIIEIANCGSITKAAEKLYMNQPNLSRAVNELESEYGITIFIRSSHGIKLTDEGHRLVAAAENIVHDVDVLDDMLHNIDAKRTMLKISVPRASYISSAFCDTIHEINSISSYSILFKESNNMNIINDVMTNGYSLGIIRIPIELEAKFKKLLTKKQLSFQEVWNFRYNIVFSKEHPLAQKEDIHLCDLKDYTVLIHDDEYVPFVSNDEIQKHTPSYDAKNKILIQERGSQFDILSSITDSYMWVSPIPDKMLNKHELIMKKCNDNNQVFVDLIIYRANKEFYPAEKMFIKNILNTKCELSL